MRIKGDKKKSLVQGEQYIYEFIETKLWGQLWGTDGLEGYGWTPLVEVVESLYYGTRGNGKGSSSTVAFRCSLINYLGSAKT